ncbi:MAG: uroporphyrinogen decarboxylase family protein [Desulfosarcinaceae bacterium]
MPLFNDCPCDVLSVSERFARLQRGESLDRVPILGFVCGYAARLAGLPLKTFYTDTSAAIRVQRQARDLHGYDDGCHFGWADWGAWEFGGEVAFPTRYRESCPRTGSHPVQRPDDVDRLPTPDPATAGMLPLLAEVNRRIRALNQPAKIQAGSPTLLAAAVAGKQNLLRWMLTAPEAVHELYDKVTAFLIAAARQTVAAFGPENCSAGYSAALDANELIGPDLFDTFVVPRLRKINQALLEMDVTAFHLHLCGDHGLNLPLWTALPWPPRMTISIGHTMNLTATAEAFGHRHIIAGNIDTRLLSHGSAADVAEDARRALAEGMTLPGGFILMSGCEMPVLAPPLNVHALVATGRTYGRYEKGSSRCRS